MIPSKRATVQIEKPKQSVIYLDQFIDRREELCESLEAFQRDMFGLEGEALFAAVKERYKEARQTYDRYCRQVVKELCGNGASD